MRMSPQGRRWLAANEANRLTAYQDSRGVWTIGVGHTGKVDGRDIAAGMAITAAKSDALLAADLAGAEGAVNAEIAGSLTQSQFDALVSFVFNVGVGAWHASSVRAEALVAADAAKVPDALFRWTKAGADLYVLWSRRASEAFLWSRGVYLDSHGKVVA